MPIEVQRIKKIFSLFLLFLVFTTAAFYTIPSAAARMQETSIPIETGLYTNQTAAPNVPISCLAEADMP